MKNQKLHISMLLLVMAFLTFSCKKTDDNKNVPNISPLPTPAALSASDIGSITRNTATINASISAEGSSAIIAKGVCWSTNHNPTIADNKTTNRFSNGSSVNSTSNGTGSVSFTATLTGLAYNTTYYVRVYATNDSGTAYSNESSFTTLDIPTTVTDIDGNVYNTIVIGGQVWMKENLRTSHYRDGSAIATNLSDAAWGVDTLGAYAIYNNSLSNNTTYGKLYNGFAVMNAKKIAPEGWHVPSRAEYDTLWAYLGGYGTAGGKMKATTLWTTPNNGATNSSGFTLLPAGYRHYSGYYTGAPSFSFVWAGSRINATFLSNWSIANTQANIIYGSADMNNGYCLRCILD